MKNLLIRRYRWDHMPICEFDNGCFNRHWVAAVAAAVFTISTNLGILLSLADCIYTSKNGESSQHKNNRGKEPYREGEQHQREFHKMKRWRHRKNFGRKNFGRKIKKNVRIVFFSENRYKTGKKYTTTSSLFCCLPPLSVQPFLHPCKCRPLFFPDAKKSQSHVWRLTI